MDSLKKFITQLNLKDQKNKIMLAAFLLLGLFAFLSGYPEKKELPTSAIGKDLNSADTFIPKGFVLVPIEVVNGNSLSSLLGEVGGVVDLYLPQDPAHSSATNIKNAHKIASHLKIVRAPYNPDLYAVLVREQESSKLLSFTGPFIAVVQNPTTDGQQVTDTKHKTILIEYQN